ncbi:hypothetical protein ACFP8W_00170 [Nocardioides hankookensis]|uniref:Uncharacterized protein n=1 Tax=Nocardioides hankookensis TaxID=443157 RepID=A0ABW1LNL6_9ACTN
MSDQMSPTVHVDLAWLALDAEFTRLLAASDGYLCPDARHGLGDAAFDFYDWGRHVPDPSMVQEPGPLAGADAAGVISGMVEQLQPLVDQAAAGADVGEYLRLERVQFFLRSAAEAQRSRPETGG